MNTSNVKRKNKNYDRSQQNMFQKFFKEGVYNEKPSDITVLEETLPSYDPSNPKCFMDIQIGDGETKRLVFELFAKKVPKTAENFRCLCTGEKSTDKKVLHYKGSIFHRVISQFMAQGGDFENANGTGGESIYGRHFNDEKVWLPHAKEGLLSMANRGANSNGSQFFLTFAKTPWLNEKHTVFGRIIKGIDFLDEIGSVKTGANDKPLTKITIVDCGEVIEDIDECELDPQVFSKESEKEVPEESKREL